MTSINFKVFCLTRLGFEPVGLRLEPTTFGFPDFPKGEAGALLIWPPQLVTVASKLDMKNKIDTRILGLEMQCFLPDYAVSRTIED